MMTMDDDLEHQSWLINQLGSAHGLIHLFKNDQIHCLQLCIEHCDIVQRHSLWSARLVFGLLILCSCVPDDIYKPIQI